MYYLFKIIPVLIHPLYLLSDMSGLHANSTLRFFHRRHSRCQIHYLWHSPIAKVNSQIQHQLAKFRARFTGADFKLRNLPIACFLGQIHLSFTFNTLLPIRRVDFFGFCKIGTSPENWLDLLAMKLGYSEP